MIAVQHRLLELVFESTKRVADDPTPVRVRFAHASGVIVCVWGFWDGGLTYRVRFSPPLAGGWSWESSSEEPSLHERAGRLVVTAGDERGPVSVAARHHFAHADGTPFRPVGATVYNWLHQPEELVESTLRSVHEGGFTKLRFMVFPQAGDYVTHVPQRLPFSRGGDGWDPARPDLGFFRHLDRAVQALGERGVQADVLIFNAYDGGRFGLDGMTESQDAIYLRYLVARLGAFAHVWWSLCNEFDLLDRADERWDRMGMLLAEVDGHGHLRSIHNWTRMYDHSRTWVTHASIQNGSAVEELGRAQLYRDVYRKPVILDEVKYEGDIPERWGRLDAREVVHRFWVATVSGCYASHGESFVTESGSLHVVEGGRLRGDAPARLGFLRRILDDLVVPGLDPIDPMDDPSFTVGVARAQYLLYLGRSAPEVWRFRLPQGHAGERLEVGDVFDVDVIDTWEMTVESVPRAFRLTEVARNDAFDGDAPSLVLPAGRPIALRITRRV